MAQCQHFVLTRFNIRQGALLTGEWVGGKPEYLEYRFGLFERFTLPSVCAQRVPFRWLVFYSASTPEPYRARALSYAKVCPAYEAVFVDDRVPLSGDLAVVSEVIRARLDEGVTHVITTRIDNDDAINVDALAWIRARAVALLQRHSVTPFVISMKNGYAYHLSACFTQYYSWDSNHYLTLVAEQASGEHILKFSHGEIRDASIPVHLIESDGAWLEVVHGGNLLNSFRTHCPIVFRNAAFFEKTFAVSLNPTLRGWSRGWLVYMIPGKLTQKFKGMARRIRSFFGAPTTDDKHQ